MGLKINIFQNIGIPNSSSETTDNQNTSLNDGADNNLEISSVDNLYAFAGDLRKFQLLQRFALTGASNTEASNVSNVRASYASAASTSPLVGGDDDETLKETQRLIENYRRQIKPSEIKGALPAEGGKTPGHPYSKHGIKPETQAEIMNNPDRIFSGINKNGRYVDIYYKNGSAVITEFGNKERVITAYGTVSTKGKTTPFNIQKIANDPKYVEIKLEKLGSTNVIYPNRERFNQNDFPLRTTNPNQPKTSGGSSNQGGTNEAKPNVVNRPPTETPVTNEPVITPKAPVTNEAVVTPKAPVTNEVPPVTNETAPVTPKSPTAVNENLPRPNPVGGLTRNLSRGLVILQLVQLGLTALNFAQLKADSEQYGYYIDPFLDKYIITDPDKAAANLPEGFQLEFFTDPHDYASIGNSVKFTVKDGKFYNPLGYTLVYNKEKGYVEAVLLA